MGVSRWKGEALEAGANLRISRSRRGKGPPLAKVRHSLRACLPTRIYCGSELEIYLFIAFTKDTIMFFNLLIGSILLFCFEVQTA